MSRAMALLRLPSLGDFVEEFQIWLKEDALWWLVSTVGHALLLVIVLLVAGTVAVKQEGDAPVFIAHVDNVIPDEPKIERLVPIIDKPDIDIELPPPVDTPLVDTDTPFDNKVSELAAETGGGFAKGESLLGGLGDFDVKSIGVGPIHQGAGGVETGKGTGNKPGINGDGHGFSHRDPRKGLGNGNGMTWRTQGAVAASLQWLANHQNPDGSWSLGEFRQRCHDGTCTTPGSTKSDTAATSMGLLPFLAAGQTHKLPGPYQKNIYAGLYWLTKQQKADGDLRGGAAMYSHGLATITLCEAYGLTYDKQIGAAAQQAIYFIVAAQNTSGGWHYAPGAVTHDTSVVGWQIMALKSGQMAGLEVPPQALTKAQNYLKIASSGQYGGLFSYVPGGGGTDTMTSVGLLCTQYLGAKRDDPRMQEGMGYLMTRLPSDTSRNCYYWYYATQVMHNLPGYEWDQWNRAMRRILIESQAKEGCARGSWNPALPTKDTWSDAGGRLMMTSLCCLTLEVYYRYLPLYKLDAGEAIIK